MTKEGGSVRRKCNATLSNFGTTLDGKKTPARRGNRTLPFQFLRSKCSAGPTEEGVVANPGGFGSRFRGIRRGNGIQLSLMASSGKCPLKHGWTPFAVTI